MSGICGIYSPNDPALASLDILNMMVEAIRHRGKAAQRTFVDNQAGVALGHVFAPVFRPPGQDTPPRWHADEDYVATLDGAIFNEEDFLPADWPLRYKDRDTGAVVEHLRQEPSEFPEKLDGHFGLAVWDKKQRDLWLVRDALGCKPLYYFHREDRGLVVFASELKGIICHPAVNRRLNHAALTVFLTLGYIPAPMSILDGIRKVYPGEILKIDARGQMTGRQYWSVPPFVPKLGELHDFTSLIREHVIQTVAKHVDGTQRIGVFLSGGVDSTIVLGVLKMLGIPERCTFTLGLRSHEKNAQDLNWAECAAQKFATRHHALYLQSASDTNFSLLEILRQFDEPIMSSNRAYGNYLMTKAAEQNGINLCLTGNHAEYLFGIGSWKRILNLNQRVKENSNQEELILFSCGQLFSFKEQRNLLVDPQEEPKEVVLNLIRRYRQEVPATDLYDVVASVQLLMEGAEKMIAFQDRTSSLNGVEVCNPFHDAQLMRFTNRIPAPFKGSQSAAMKRTALISAFGDILPEAIAKRQKAAYPMYVGSFGEVDRLKQLLLSSSGLERTGLFRSNAVQQILEVDTQSPRNTVGKQAWALLTVQVWFELYVNGNVNLNPG